MGHSIHGAHLSGLMNGIVRLDDSEYSFLDVLYIISVLDQHNQPGHCAHFYAQDVSAPLELASRVFSCDYRYQKSHSLVGKFRQSSMPLEIYVLEITGTFIILTTSKGPHLVMGVYFSSIR